MKNFRRN